MARSDYFKLTKYAKNDLLSELNLTVKSNSDYNLIKPDSFLEKKDLQCIRTMSGRRTFVNTFD